MAPPKGTRKYSPRGAYKKEPLTTKSGKINKNRFQYLRSGDYRPINADDTGAFAAITTDEENTLQNEIDGTFSILLLLQIDKALV